MGLYSRIIDVSVDVIQSQNTCLKPVTSLLGDEKKKKKTLKGAAGV